MLSINLNNVPWNEFIHPTKVNVHVPREFTGLSESVQGTLDVSDQGYVYALSSRPVLWLKFLGLATYLSISGLVAKCKLLAKAILQKPIGEKEIQDLDHIFHLAAIAGKAVISKGGCPLKARVEQFAMAEIDYNNSSRSEEMSILRSIRLTNGAYVAKCMQPLFHSEQVPVPRIRLKEEIQNLESEQQGLIHEKQERPSRSNSWELGNFLSWVRNPYAKLSEKEIEERLITIEIQLVQKKKLLDVADRCSKYAALAILKQQGCLNQAMKNAFVDQNQEGECCGVVWYKQQRICGLLYQIECCAQRCWAVNCGCCCCVIAPECQTLLCLC